MSEKYRISISTDIGEMIIKISHSESRHGKVTNVVILLGGCTFIGASPCHIKDEFNKVVERDIAFARAFTKLFESREMFGNCAIPQL